MVPTICYSGADVHEPAMDVLRIRTDGGLFLVLRQCPYLEVLQLLIDTVNIDIDPIEAESFQHTSVQELHAYSD